MRKPLVLLSIALIAVFLLGSGTKESIYEGDTLSAALKATSSPLESNSIKVDISLGKIPLHFIPNEGQVDGRVSYYVQGRDKTIYFTPEGLTFVLNGDRESELVRSKERRGRKMPGAKKARIYGFKESNGTYLDEEMRGIEPRSEFGELADRRTPERWVVKLDFVDANPGVRPVGVEETGAVISYFKGKPEEWKTGLPAYSKIVYEDLWPGVDLLYHGTFDRMKYEFVVQPGADPSQIRLAYRGAESVRLTNDGRLALETPAGGFEDEVPVAWQEKEGAKARVSIAYVLEASAEERLPDHAMESGKALAAEEANQGSPLYIYGFDVGEYDRTLPLVLDPAVLVYCGYIGGSGADHGYGIAVDASGNAYVTGYTYSTQPSFPVLSGPDLSHNGNYDAFVAKVNSAGTALLYCGYIGGSGVDHGYGIAVDASGNAYITGETYSTQPSFPVLSGPDLSHNGNYDAFVAKVDPSGTALLYCGYIGGSGADHGYGIAVDASGNAYVTGYTYSTQPSFPVLSGPDLSHNGNYDAFVARIFDMKTYVFDGHDFDGNGTSDASVFRPSNGRWYIKGVGGSVWGTAGDIPVNGDYNGDGTTDIAVWRSANGRWYIQGVADSVWGTAGDIPVPGNYNGDVIGTTDIAVWRPSNGRWYIKGVAGSVWGTADDIPVPGDYNGDGTTDVAVWRPSNGRWYIKGVAGSVWGTAGDIPVPADYNGDGTTDIAVWRPSNGRWYIKGVAGSAWGTMGDIPAPGDYNGDGKTDITIWRPSNGRWYIKGIGGYIWGMIGDIPLVR